MKRPGLPVLARWGLLIVVCASLGAGLRPLARAHAVAGRVDVFVAQDRTTGAANIYFLDALSGLSTVINASNGERFTLLGTYVIYQKQQSGAIMRANLNGTLEPHPFVRSSVDTHSVRWVVSPDARAIAWVTVSAEGESAAYVAWADGSGQQQLPIASPGAPEVIAPVALTNDMTRFIFDAAHPLDTTSLFDTYAELVEYDLTTSEQRDLATGSDCLCDVAMDPSGRILARLEGDSSANGSGPFALHVWDLPTGAETRIPAPDLPYPLGGDLILNSTGTYAIYTAAAGEGDEAEVPAGDEAETSTSDEVEVHTAEYGLVLVNIVSAEQYLVLPPSAIHYRPLAFIDSDDALLLVDAATGATYKLDLIEHTVQQVSDRLYLGAITTE